MTHSRVKEGIKNSWISAKVLRYIGSTLHTHSPHFMRLKEKLFLWTRFWRSSRPIKNIIDYDFLLIIPAIKTVYQPDNSLLKKPDQSGLWIGYLCSRGYETFPPFIPHRRPFGTRGYVPRVKTSPIGVLINGFRSGSISLPLTVSLPQPLWVLPPNSVQ